MRDGDGDDGLGGCRWSRSSSTSSRGSTLHHVAPSSSTSQPVCHCRRFISPQLVIISALAGNLHTAATDVGRLASSVVDIASSSDGRTGVLRNVLHCYTIVYKSRTVCANQQSVQYQSSIIQVRRQPVRSIPCTPSTNSQQHRIRYLQSFAVPNSNSTLLSACLVDIPHRRPPLLRELECLDCRARCSKARCSSARRSIARRSSARTSASSCASRARLSASR
jgi:hypothetical protein